MGCSSSKGPRDKTDLRLGTDATPVASIPRIKLVLLGDSGVGKSCLVLRYVRGQFDASSKVTVGAAFMSHSITLKDGTTVKFEIWDTAGQERYASLAPLYYRGAAAAAIVYDITSAESFQKAKHWVGELAKNASGEKVVVLVGNKSDLEEERIVTTEVGQEYAERNGMLFLETSAKTAANVASVFEALAERVAGEGRGKSLPAAPVAAAAA